MSVQQLQSFLVSPHLWFGLAVAILVGLIGFVLWLAIGARRVERQLVAAAAAEDAKRQDALWERTPRRRAADRVTPDPLAGAAPRLSRTQPHRHDSLLRGALSERQVSALRRNGTL